MSDKRHESRLPFLLLLFFAIGVPTATGVAFADKVSSNPWKAALVATLFELCLFLVSFVAKIIRGLEERWLEKIIGALDLRFKHLFRRERGKYLETVARQHRVFDVKGLVTQGIYPLELEQVFVALSVVPQAPHMTSSNPIHRLPIDLSSGSHSIWEYLRSSQLSLRNLAVLGPPGSGKTTLLKHTLLVLSSSRYRRIRLRTPRLIPILLPLSNLAVALKSKSDYTLAQAVRETTLTSDSSLEWLEIQLRRGRCLIMLDGLDEIADPLIFRNVVEWIEKQATILGANRFIVTSRPYGFRGNPLPAFTVLAVHPFTHSQIDLFVRQWYLANAIGGTPEDKPVKLEEAGGSAHDLMFRLESTPALLALAVNPLLLTMIATVHHYRGALPERRIELYFEICEVFLGRRRQAKGLDLDFSPSQKIQILKPLAFFMMRSERREIKFDEIEEVLAGPIAESKIGMSCGEFLRTIEDGSGLLLKDERGDYTFVHLTFQEYLAAVHCVEHDLSSDLASRVSQPWWHETLRLYAALADASLIIESCLNEEHLSTQILLLAIECLEESRIPLLGFQSRLEAFLDAGVEHKRKEHRCAVGAARLALRLRHMRPQRNEVAIDNRLITNCEYQIFLDEKMAGGEDLIPDHWPKGDFLDGTGDLPVVGVRSVDAGAFCQWLSGREGGIWQYRLPVPSELSGLHYDSPHSCWVEDGAGGKKRLQMVTRGTRPSIRLGSLESYVYFDFPFGDFIPLPTASLEGLNIDELLALAEAYGLQLQREVESVRFTIFDLGVDRTLGRPTPWTWIVQASTNVNFLLRQASAAASKEQNHWGHRLDLLHCLKNAAEMTRDLYVALRGDSEREFPVEMAITDRAELAKYIVAKLELCLGLERAFMRLLQVARRVAERLSIKIGREAGRALDIARSEILDFDPVIQAGIERARHRGVDLAQAYSAFENAIPEESDDVKHLRQVIRLLVARSCSKFVESNDEQEVLRFLRWYSRAALLGLISHFLVAEIPATKGERIEQQNLCDSVVDIFITLALIEERRAGRDEAFEAIQIVKERRGA